MRKGTITSFMDNMPNFKDSVFTNPVLEKLGSGSLPKTARSFDILGKQIALACGDTCREPG